jgi:hypothetical protein
VDGRTGTALDVFGDRSIVGEFALKQKSSVVTEYVDRCQQFIDIRIVPPERRRFGRVPVYADVAKESGVALIGCDAGVNGSGLADLIEIGKEIYKKYGLGLLNDVIDRVCAQMALRLVDIAVAERLVFPHSSIGFTGRAAISGRKPEYILEGLTERHLFEDPNDHLVFVDDGLARGAALMGRCMNSLGKPRNPIGGVWGGPCIMNRRIKAGK